MFVKGQFNVKFELYLEILCAQNLFFRVHFDYTLLCLGFNRVQWGKDLGSSENVFQESGVSIIFI